MHEEDRALEVGRTGVSRLDAHMLRKRVHPSLHIAQHCCSRGKRTNIGFFASVLLDRLGGSIGSTQMRHQAMEPHTVVGHGMRRGGGCLVVWAAYPRPGVLDGARAVIAGDLELFKSVEDPPQLSAQFSGQRNLPRAHLVLVQAYCVCDADGGAREVPAGVAVVAVVQVDGREQQRLHGRHARGEDDDGQQRLHPAPPHLLLVRGEGDAGDAARQQQHAQEAAQPRGVDLVRARQPHVVGLAERRLVEDGQVDVDVGEEGGEQRLEAGRAGEAAALGRQRIVGGGRGRGGEVVGGEVVGVAVLARLLLGGVVAKQHKLAEGAGPDQRAQLDVEGKGAGGADELHLALLVGEQRRRVLARGVAVVAVAAGLARGCVGQRDAQRGAQLAQSFDIRHVRFGQQPLDQRLEQRQAVPQALDAAVQALLARLRRQARDVVHHAVPARLVAGLAPALLLARLALVAARLGALPLVQRHAPRAARRGARGRRRGRCRRRRCDHGGGACLAAPGATGAAIRSARRGGQRTPRSSGCGLRIGPRENCGAVLT